MQLAIVHYHLNRGGVSQVIANHLASLATLPEDQRPERAAVLFSGSRDGWPDNLWEGTAWGAEPPFEIVYLPIPLLEYDNAVACESEQLAAAMHAALASAGFSADDTVLHTHNHALGKNASLPGALRELATQGYRLLLQIHDFAEDFRPANYRHLMRATGARGPEELAQSLYPQAKNIHYATLNGRDLRVMAQAGAEQLHLLANPVDEFVDLPPIETAAPKVRKKLGLDPCSPLVVYPVRGIRRKNVGELLLHAALGNGEMCFAVTLAPENPAELVSFDRWHELSVELGLNCRMGIGQAGSGRRGVNFLDALSAANALITTSVAEGFGMVFLEAWLAGKPLIGRNLPEITADFADSGVRYPGLRDQLLIPAEWFDLEAARTEVLELHNWACRDYGLSNNATPADDWMSGAGGIDFGRLPQRFQAQAIRHVVSSPTQSLQAVEELNPGYCDNFDAHGFGDCDEVPANAQVVREVYSLRGVGQRLAEVYSSLLSSTPDGQVGSLPQGENIVQYFLHLQRIHPVRLEP